MSPTSDSTFAELQQTIDDLRRQLAERTAECDEALARETAIAEVLQVINSSPGELVPVFDVMLETAARLCEADGSRLYLRVGEAVRVAAQHGKFATGISDAGKPFVPHPDTALAQALKTRQPAKIDDTAPYFAHAMAADEDWVQRPSVAEGWRSLFVVPMLRENELVGAIATYRREARPFEAKHIGLVENFAAQAVIAVENARLITETREALEQQTATAEVLGVINASPGDLTPVFDVIVEKAMRLCSADEGGLRTFDGEAFHLVSMRGGEPKAIERLRHLGPLRPLSETSFYGRLMRGEHVVHIHDVRETDIYRDNPEAQERLDIRGIRSWLGVTLHKEHTLLGVLIIHRQEVRPFTDKQIALLQNFAAQAVIAMENARLITETREALEQQTATAEVLGVINSSPGDLAPVFDAMLEKATRLCDAAYGLLATYDVDGFRGVAAIGFPMESANALSRIGHPPARTALGQVERIGQSVQITDISIEPAYDEVYAINPWLRRVRTNVVVPLLNEGVLAGAFIMFREQVRPFTDKQIALLQNFAAQAVIAMENARLITETREALDQQTATAEVLGVINSSPGDLTPVFDAMLEKALHLCEASYGALQTYNGEHVCMVAHRGNSRYHEAQAHLGPFRPEPGSTIEALVKGESIVHVLDLATDQKYAAAGPLRRALVEIGGARTFLSLALRKDGSLLGALHLYRQEVRPFSEKEIALLQNFAAQAVIAMENARLITETREALEQQTAAADVLQVINSSPGDLAPVFDAILEKAHSLCGVTFGFLQLYDSGKLRAVALRGVPEAVVEPARQGFSPSPNHPIRGLLDGVPYVHIRDLAEIDDPAARRVAQLGGIRTSLFVPLRKDGTLLGMISAGRKEIRPFAEKQIALLQSFAAQAVIAMENARLLGELRQRTEEVAELNRGLEARIAEQVEELGRVGRLKRFLAPQLAELIVSQGDEKILESHRREIVVVFCDLRGYTAFTETAEPEEVLDFLREYHGALGPLVSHFEGTLDQFSGDGIMVFFNDPVPIPDPAERAVNMAVAMREAAGQLIAGWRERGRDLGFGAGIAQGYATLGQIGFSERSGYTAIGTVCNVAARLCAEAKDGQILLSQRVNAALKGNLATEQVGALALKGLTQPVIAFNVPLAASQPALRVIEGGPQNV
jgi:GAF domain-containing protein